MTLLRQVSVLWQAGAAQGCPSCCSVRWRWPHARGKTTVLLVHFFCIKMICYFTKTGSGQT
eukprot:COSAG06_NODE_3715_length_4984_cov_3.899284_6_plen_61_part_00